MDVARRRPTTRPPAHRFSGVVSFTRPAGGRADRPMSRRCPSALRRSSATRRRLTRFVRALPSHGGNRIMLFAESLRVGYVVKRYPCFSETFIVREKAGLDIEIFSLRPTKDGQFQDLIARVRAPVNYLF